MRLPGYRVRTLMLTVAGVAAILWGSTMGARSFEYHRRARFYGEQESGWRRSAAQNRLGAEFTSECVAYFAGLTRKYRRATWRPWVPVAPDPHAPGYDRWLEQERRAKQAGAPRTAP